MARSEVAPSQDAGALIESVIIKGDLGKLSPKERAEYYVRVCQTVGLNPFTRPFEYIVLNGQLRLYARKDATEQLRKINGISLKVGQPKVEDDLVMAHAQATDKTGRSDEDYGAVTIAGLRGEVKANAILKCITKAKRRVTLSISGLGYLDETEVDDIPVKDVRPSPVSAAAELDEFAGVSQQEDPFGLPPPPPGSVAAPSRPRSPIWQQDSYRHEPTLTFDTEQPDWAKWRDDMIFFAGDAASGDELDKLRIDNRDLLNLLRRTNGDLYHEIVAAFTTRRGELNAEAAS